VDVNLVLGAAAIATGGVIGWWALSGPRDARSSARKNLAVDARPIADLRTATLALPATERAVAPAMRSIATRARKLTPQGMVETLERRIFLAGASAWSLDRVLVTKVALAGVIGFLLSMRLLVDPSAAAVLLVAAGMLGGYLLPDLLLSNAATKRQEQIRLELPDTLDQMTISVEAGLGFEAAMARAGRSGDGPLAQELVRTLQEVQAGMSSTDALRGLAERTDVAELRHFVLAVRQAESYGIPVAQVLRVQAGELRVKRRQRAEERAMKLPVKVVFPLVLCILPALLVVLMGPAAMRVANNIVS